MNKLKEKLQMKKKQVQGSGEKRSFYQENDENHGIYLGEGQKMKNDERFEIVPDKIVQKNWTTLMIRNIPNKYTKEQMLATLNKKFKDQFDFFYLPIDFFNDCNVGYAFINFVSVKEIESFYRTFNNQKWA
jgi:RNA recognition motif-containing protein